MPKEPWFSRTQKIVAAVISCLVLAGMFWNYGAKADARYAKEEIVSKELANVKKDVAMLGRAFQYDQLDRALGSKQDMLFKIDNRLQEKKVSPDEKARLQELKRSFEREYEGLRDKQKKLEN
jgi:hypothetical protein